MKNDGTDFVAAGEIDCRHGSYALSIKNYVLRADAVSCSTKQVKRLASCLFARVVFGDGLTSINAMQHQCLHTDSSQTAFLCWRHSQSSHS